MKTKIILLTIFLSFIFNISYSQKKDIEIKIDSLAKIIPEINDTINLSVNNISFQELLRSVSKLSNVNVCSDNSISLVLSLNFKNIKISNLLLFLCHKYQLDIHNVGKIIYLSQKLNYKNKTKLFYDSITQNISLEINNDSLFNVIRILTHKTNKNIIITPDIQNNIINSYIKDAPFYKTIENIALSNNLLFSLKKDSTVILSSNANKNNISTQNTTYNNSSNNYSNNYSSNDFSFDIENNSKINIYAINFPIKEIIKQISKELNINYFLFNDIKENITLSLKKVSYDELLNYLFISANYYYVKDTNNIYLFGEKNNEKIRNTKLYKFKYRSSNKIIDKIPAELKKGVEIIELADLNCIMLSGSGYVINELENYLNALDKRISQVLIELIIIDDKSFNNISTGISMGVGDKPTVTKGVLFPEYKMDFSSNSVNEIIKKFNSLGLFNIGKVNQNFYLSLKALEENGIIKIRSTPKLSTLNGSEAKMKIGKTEYYVEETNNVYGAQIPQNIITKQYKSVTADMSITITPYISDDDNITLIVNVEQSDFAGRISPNAPPSQVTRSFSSQIRIKNEEMILLGGLEEVNSENNGSGVPWLSRIPVIKWFFSSKTKKNNKGKLNVFIKPTLIN